jgi:N-acetylmuramoyl-L-alanine amidase
MATYTVKFYSGSYRARQNAANADKAICFVAHHLNSAGSEKADYALCDVATNASKTSKALASWYVHKVAETFGVNVWSGGDGVCVGGMDGRGNSQIYFTNMPAILPEPLFCSNPRSAKILRGESGRRQLAEILAASIREFFPQGGLVAFSVGHRGKPKSSDAGAVVYAKSGEPVLWEADVTQDILERAADLLTSK